MNTRAATNPAATLAPTRLLSNQGHSRRRFLRSLAGLAVSLPGALLLGGCGAARLAEPQPAVVPRIGYLDPGSKDSSAPGSKDSSADELAAFRDELRQLGYAAFELAEPYFKPYFANRDDTVLEELAAELVAQQPDVIVAFGTAAIQAAITEVDRAERRIPIVMAASSDPVGTGLVSSLARPGANVTGLTSIAPQLTGKRLQLLKQAFPEVKRVAYLLDLGNRGDEEERRQIEAVYQSLGVTALVPVGVTPPGQLQTNLAQAVADGAQALVTFASAVINRNPEPITEFAKQHRLPAMYAQADFVGLHGGLMSYGPDYHDMYRRAAVFVDKIVRGRSPAELPVEKPRRFSLLLNGKAVQAQGFVLPRSFLAQVDEVVES